MADKLVSRYLSLYIYESGIPRDGGIIPPESIRGKRVHPESYRDGVHTHLMDQIVYNIFRLLSWAVLFFCHSTLIWNS